MLYLLQSKNPTLQQQNTRTMVGEYGRILQKTEVSPRSRIVVTTLTRAKSMYVAKRLCAASNLLANDWFRDRLSKHCQTKI